jgi:hypothetical protein
VAYVRLRHKPQQVSGGSAGFVGLAVHRVTAADFSGFSCFMLLLCPQIESVSEQDAKHNIWNSKGEGNMRVDKLQGEE